MDRCTGVLGEPPHAWGYYPRRDLYTHECLSNGNALRTAPRGGGFLGNPALRPALKEEYGRAQREGLKVEWMGGPGRVRFRSGSAGMARGSVVLEQSPVRSLTRGNARQGSFRRGWGAVGVKCN